LREAERRKQDDREGLRPRESYAATPACAPGYGVARDSEPRRAEEDQVSFASIILNCS
jgi:hypothetical protein